MVRYRIIKITCVKDWRRIAACVPTKSPEVVKAYIKREKRWDQSVHIPYGTHIVGALLWIAYHFYLGLGIQNADLDLEELWNKNFREHEIFLKPAISQFKTRNFRAYSRRAIPLFHGS